MASFIIHEDHENDNLRLRKENTEVFSTAPQRRALGDINNFACNQSRNVKLTGLPNGPVKSQDVNRTLRQINNEKNIVPPVAQFRAFSVYEDNPKEVEQKKREPTCKPFAVKDFNKEKPQIVIEKTQTIPAKNESEPPNETTARIPLQDKQDVTIESPMSVAHDSSVMSININEISVTEDDDDVVVAQTDRENFFHVVQYREDIYCHMRELETKHRPYARYMQKQPDINYSMRAILVDWLVEVCEEYSQHSETLYLAVSYVDRFLSCMSVVRGKLQLVGTAATFIAAKYEEVYPPEVSDFVYITDNTYTKREVLRMEHLMLKVLSFDLATPTALAFLSHYCISKGISKKIFHLASFITELSLLEADPYLQFKPSMLAAAALATARHCMLCTHCDEEVTLDNNKFHEECGLIAWPDTLQVSSGYSLIDLNPCTKQLARTHAHASQQPNQAIIDKYRNSKFDKVSSVAPRAMYSVPKYEPLQNASGRSTAPAK